MLLSKKAMRRGLILTSFDIDTVTDLYNGLSAEGLPAVYNCVVLRIV